MPSAYVLINTLIEGDADVILEAVRRVEGVEEAYNLYGVYDIIAKIRIDTMDKLKNLVTRRIRRLNGVRSTLTMIVIEG